MFVTCIILLSIALIIALLGICSNDEDNTAWALLVAIIIGGFPVLHLGRIVYCECHDITSEEYTVVANFLESNPDYKYLIDKAMDNGAASIKMNIITILNRYCVKTN